MPLPGEWRLARAVDVQRLIQEQVELVRQDESIKPAARAYCVGFLCQKLLSAIAAGDVEQRIEQIEERMRNINARNIEENDEPDQLAEPETPEPETPEPATPTESAGSDAAA